MPIPDLDDVARFPPFMGLLEGDADREPGDDDCCLLAQIKDDMTITKPTLVLTDRDGHPFALVFAGFDRDGLDLAKRGLKKGATVVVPGARRTTPAGAGDGAAAAAASSPPKRPILRVARDRVDTVRVVAAPLDAVLATAAQLRGRRGPQQRQRQCAACGATTTAALEGAPSPAAADGPNLLKCTGCGEAWYCDRACQTKDWTDGSHKVACRAVRGIVAIWGR